MQPRFNLSYLKISSSQKVEMHFICWWAADIQLIKATAK